MTTAAPVGRANGKINHDTLERQAIEAEGKEPANERPKSTPTTVASVIDVWRTEGALMHEPTGIARLDELTGGGPVYGSRWYLSGAPDAAKTLLELQVGHAYAQRGIAVGLLAADEDAGDLVTRLAQRIGYERSHCEVRDPAVLAEMRTALAGLPIRFYGPEVTIEAAAADLSRWARERADADPTNHPRGPRAMLGVDSIQTVRCAAELATERPLTDAAAVTARAHAVRDVATRHRLIVLATSEQSRGAYASRDASQRTSALAAGKWSGAIEYSARVLLALTSVAGESDLVQLEVAKSKHGPRTRDDGEPGHLYLRLDRRAQSLAAVDYVPPPDDHAAARDESARARVQTDAEGVLAVVVGEPGIETRDLYAACRAALGIGRYRVDAALAELGDRLERRPGARGSRQHYPAGGAA